MGQGAKKTEHSGAKKGCGAYWGRKVAAKKESNRQRREDDKVLISEDSVDEGEADLQQSSGGVQAGAVIFQFQVGFYAEITQQVHHSGYGHTCDAGRFFQGRSS